MQLLFFSFFELGELLLFQVRVLLNVEEYQPLTAEDITRDGYDDVEGYYVLQFKKNEYGYCPEDEEAVLRNRRFGRDYLGLNLLQLLRACEELSQEDRAVYQDVDSLCELEFCKQGSNVHARMVNTSTNPEGPQVMWEGEVVSLQELRDETLCAAQDLIQQITNTNPTLLTLHYIRCFQEFVDVRK